MPPRVTQVVPFSEEAIPLAVEILRAGGLVAYPTDTVYGLGAHVFLPEAVERVYEVKGRPAGVPIPVLIGDTADLQVVAREVPEIVQRLAAAFWPGPLTIVLPKSPCVPPLITAGGDGVGVRIPDHSLLRSLIRRLEAPITGTSANLSGQPSPLTPEEVLRQLQDRIDLILDGGRCPRGVPSTVLDLTGPKPHLVREGPITREVLRRYLPEL